MALRKRYKRTGITAINNLSKAFIKELAASEKLLPHELLLYWANGYEVAGFKPTPNQQIYAAVSAAPYYAPKLANIEVKQDTRIRAVISAAPMNQEQWAEKYLDGGGGDVSSTLVQQLSKTISLNESEPVSLPTITETSLPLPISQQNKIEIVTSSSPPLFSEQNRKSLESHTHISPSTAHPNLSCFTDTNDVSEDDDDDTL